MRASYRPVLPEEIPAAAELFLTSLADLARRNGRTPPSSYTQASVEPVFHHLLETGIFDVAECDGRIVAICSAIVRDKIWFLSMFWTLPEFQRRGLGRPLLERVHQEGVRRGAQMFCTWSSIDYAAIATYLRLGMMPGGPIFTFAGPVLNEPDQEAAVCMRALESTSACAIDRVVRGTTRAVDHAYWLQARGASGFQLEKAGKVSGYFYVNAGVIGPAAWLTREDGAPLLACALREAKKQAPEAGLMAIGTNEDAIQVALRAGLRIAGTSHWLRSTSFGMLDRYLPSGPALF